VDLQADTNVSEKHMSPSSDLKMETTQNIDVSEIVSASVIRGQRQYLKRKLTPFSHG
jgi:hypothetical protein